MNILYMITTVYATAEEKAATKTKFRKERQNIYPIRLVTKNNLIESYPTYMGNIKDIDIRN